ncbi:MAG TPA: M1 family aminopeptidase [Flavobacteriaceae bacterium]|mgnify:CR=1 FL=1|nr:T9SS type A sorting domain-containing protein [Flavobacteriaceae bacterium]MCB9213003.1 T9SS type A sorting domain-containing protein [Alteromonas sp.]HPF10908.1 M1 family aminopeptidase [Flavobacteriaceae bacterium]HQU20350.1 M1 family aminopeptidase [Flavobacteriaceae bacterium]HQU64242.1 M1 family aminopeptidase [Flavobacteriaceae bacterium]
MKSKILLFSILAITVSLQAQVRINDDLASLVESEMKSALKIKQGSRNMNTGNYDLKYHRLELTVDPSVAFIAGDITSYFEAKEDLDQVTFELANNMVVSQVLQRGNSLTFTQNSNDEVIISLPVTQLQGVLDSLTISYSGNPVSSGFGSFEQSSHNGDPIIWTLSEPYGAKAWWPCKQDLIDKIDVVDIYVTAPQFNPSGEENFVAANGVEQGQVVNGPNKTTHFRHQHPIPAYLVAFAITNYAIYSHTVPNNGNPFPIVNYVYPEDLSSAQNDTPISVDIMELYTDLFEEYPYADEKYGHAQFGWGGGMEHTTVSFMGGFSSGLIAHEMAHQWFGDKVTCGSWQDIWLNEGFATYLAALVIENFDGEASFKSWRQGKVSNITSQPDGSIYVPAADTTSVSRVFSSRLSYNKGSMALHMLRRKLGDATFFQGLQEYLADSNLAYGYAKTEDLKATLESVSGQDLTQFFNDWIYGEGYPSYHLEWQRLNATQIEVTVNQTQSDNSVSFFEAPLPIRIYGTGGEEEDMLLDNDSDGQVFVLDVAYEIGIIVVDPDAHIISRNNSVVLGTDAYLTNASLIVYPNPANDRLYLQKPSDVTLTQITFYDVLGRTLKTMKGQQELSLQGLPSGLLFLKIETNRGTVQRTIVKQ